MGSNNTRGLSPRQKMINLMYIVLTAMLALNVSSDVLEGFKQVENGLSRSNDNVSERNDVLYRRLEAFNEQNPGKGGVWYDKASEAIRKRSTSIWKISIIFFAGDTMSSCRNTADTAAATGCARIPGISLWYILMIIKDM